MSPPTAGTVVARGHLWTIRRHGKRVTVTPAAAARLRHPFARTAHFRVRDVRYLEVREPGWWRPGWVFLALDIPDEHAHPDEHQPGVIVTYPRTQRTAFTDLVAGGGWRQIYLVR